MVTLLRTPYHYSRVNPEAEMTIPSKDTDRRSPNGKLMQICASQNDLFALDSEGIVYQYDFKAKRWERLDERRAVSARPHDD
jgi:hypothetical protein